MLVQNRSRLALAALLSSLLIGVTVEACGDDDEAAGATGTPDAGFDVASPDATTTDAKPNDTGTGAETTTTDSGTDAGADTSIDANDASTLPACVPAPTGGVVLATTGYNVETIASGTPLVDPVGITFGRDGRMYIANSHSWLTVGTNAGEILRLESDGGFATFVSDNRLRGPGWVAFGPGGPDGGPGIAYMGTEDSDEALVHATDQLLIQNGTLSEGPDVAEPGRLAFGPGGAFGTALYFSARSNPNPATIPNPARLMRWDPTDAGAPSEVIITSIANPIGAVSGFTFAHGGTLGNDLYVSTVLDPGYTLNASVAVWRVDSSFAATAISTGQVMYDITASPDPTGAWGDFIYGNTIVGEASTAGRVVRIDPSGTITDIVTNLTSYGTVEFGPDGALYFTDITAHAIYRLTRCQ